MSGPTAYLPFLSPAEHRGLREIGSALLSLPASWVFKLLFADGCAHVERYNARRGVQQYEETAWAADAEHEHEGLLREVAFVVPFDATLDEPRGRSGDDARGDAPEASAGSDDDERADSAPVVRVRERQRLIQVSKEQLVFESRAIVSKVWLERREVGGPTTPVTSAAVVTARWVIQPARMLAATTCHVRASAAGGPAGVALGSAHFNAWRQAAAEYSYSEAMGLALGLHASAPEALVAVRGGGATPSLRTSGIGPAPLAVREAAVRRVVLDPAPERSAAAAVAATARSPLALLPPLPSSERSDLGAPYAPWPEADALDGPAPDETDSPIDDDSTAGEMLLDAITGAARAVEAEHSLLDGDVDDAAEPSRSDPEKAAHLLSHEVDICGATLGLQFGCGGGEGNAAIVTGTQGFDAAGGARPPCIGARLYSVNGVRVIGLSFTAALTLTKQPARPLALSFLESHVAQTASSATTDDDGASAEPAGGEPSSGPRALSARDVIEAILHAPKARELRQTIDDFVRDFNDCEIETLRKGDRAHSRAGGASSDDAPPPPPPPHLMVWSAIGHAKHELREQRVFGDLLPPRAGWGVPSPSELQLQNAEVLDAAVAQHIESRIFEVALRCSPTAAGASEAAGASDDPTQAELLDDDAFRQVLSKLRFLSLEQLGCPANINLADESELGFEWLMAQTELHRATAHARCVADICSALRSACRFASAAVEALTNRAREAKRRPTNYRAVGTDELLPAITFIMLRCNPERLGSIIWFASRFSQEEALQGEDGFALANFDAALSFLRRVATQPRLQLCGCDVERAPGEPAPPTTSGDDGAVMTPRALSDALELGCNASELLAAVQQSDVSAVRAVLQRAPRETRRQLVVELSVDQSVTPLCAAVDALALVEGAATSSRRKITTAGVEAGAMQDKGGDDARAVLSALLLVFGDAPTGDPSCAATAASSARLIDTLVCPVYGPHLRQTALMRAASQGSLMLSLALLRAGADPARADGAGASAAVHARRAGHTALAEALDAASAAADAAARGEALSIALAAREGDARRVRGLLLLGADADELREGDTSACGGYTALIAAACHGDAALLRALLSRPAAALRDPLLGSVPDPWTPRPDGRTANARDAVWPRAAARAWPPARHAALRATCATVDKPNALGETALMRAVGLQSGRRRASARSQVNAAKALLAAGASRTSRDARRRTALDWANACDNDGVEGGGARRWGHERLVNILRLDPSRDAVFDAARDGKVADVVALLEQGSARVPRARAVSRP